MTFIVLCEKCRGAEADEEGTCQMTQAKARALQACFVSGVCVVVCAAHVDNLGATKFQEYLAEKEKNQKQVLTLASRLFNTLAGSYIHRSVL